MLCWRLDLRYQRGLGHGWFYIMLSSPAPSPDSQLRTFVSVSAACPYHGRKKKEARPGYLLESRSFEATVETQGFAGFPGKASTLVWTKSGPDIGLSAVHTQLARLLFQEGTHDPRREGKFQACCLWILGSFSSHLANVFWGSMHVTSMVSVSVLRTPSLWHAHGRLQGPRSNESVPRRAGRCTGQHGP